MATTKNNNTENNMSLEAISMDEVEGFVTMDAKEVMVSETRFRPLNEAMVKQVAESIEHNGQLQPILVTATGDLIDGNHRLHACKSLGIQVIAKIVEETNMDKLALMEIDTNLMRKELTATEMENHLAERKRLYNILYPDTAKRGKKGADASGQKSFSEDTAETIGASSKSVERQVKRGQEASIELQTARDNKEITTGDVDAIIKETGGDVHAQHLKMKELIQAKADKKATKDKERITEAKEEEELPPEIETIAEEFQEDNMKLTSDLQKVRDDFDTLTAEYTKLEKALEKEKKSVKTLRDRIAKAKVANPDVKI